MAKILYLGLRAPPPAPGDVVVHYPVIRVEPITGGSEQRIFSHASQFSHVVLTSQTCVNVMAVHYPGSLEKMRNAEFLVVGQATADILDHHRLHAAAIAHPETAEGLVSLLKGWLSPSAYVFWPHSRRARPVIRNYLLEARVKHKALALYNTTLQRPGPPPAVEDFDKIVFTSPSTVEGFLSIYGRLPHIDQTQGIGPITAAALTSSRHALDLQPHQKVLSESS